MTNIHMQNVGLINRMFIILFTLSKFGMIPIPIIVNIAACGRDTVVVSSIIKFDPGLLCHSYIVKVPK